MIRTHIFADLMKNAEIKLSEMQHDFNGDDFRVLSIISGTDNCEISIKDAQLQDIIDQYLDMSEKERGIKNASI